MYCYFMKAAVSFMQRKLHNFLCQLVSQLKKKDEGRETRQAFQSD